MAQTWCPKTHTIYGNVFYIKYKCTFGIGYWATGIERQAQLMDPNSECLFSALQYGLRHYYHLEVFTIEKFFKLWMHSYSFFVLFYTNSLIMHFTKISKRQNGPRAKQTSKQTNNCLTDNFSTRVDWFVHKILKIFWYWKAKYKQFFKSIRSRHRTFHVRYENNMIAEILVCRFFS